jgi:hypothetical protein
LSSFADSRSANAADKTTGYGVNLRLMKTLCSDCFAIASIPAATDSALNRALKAAEKRANTGGNSIAYVADTVAVERRELCMQVVNLKPHPKRRVPSGEIR